MVKITKCNPRLLFHFKYAGYVINIYPRRITEKAVEFLLFDSKNNITKKCIWIPKIGIKREGKELLDVNWLFDNYENREKLEEIGYWL